MAEALKPKVYIDCFRFRSVFTEGFSKNHSNSSKFSKKLRRMRTTRQSSTRTESDDITMQQVMEMMQGLQEAMKASKAEQERIQVDLAASQARNEELCRANEELRRGLRNHPGSRETEDRECFTPPREFPMPFSQSIMEAMIPHTFVGPKVTFTGMEDPEAHLTAFHTQMMLVGGSDAVRCKLFMSTLTGMLSQLFREQYIANRAPPPVSYDLFDVKQYQGETLKEYINRSGAQVVKVGTTKEPMIVYAFRKGIFPGPFCESIIRNRPRTFAEIRRRAVEHIAIEGEVCEKSASVAPARPRTQSRAQPARVNKAATGRRDRLRVPTNTDKVLGPHKDAWCEFHQAFGHHITNCLALGHQLDELVKSGFLKDYLVGPSAAAALAVLEEDQAHEMPIHGEVHTIFGGFSGGGCIASQRKRYVRSVNSVVEQEADDSLDIDLAFTKADLRDVVPHNNDPVVISVVTAGRKVHRVLVDQGSSANVMFWSTFNKLQLSLDQLRSYTGCLYGFAGDQVEVRGYLELRTKFTDETASRTENIRYLVVNANSAYNILLGRPALNRLKGVASTRHMKLKLPDLSGRVILIKSDQQEAKKCYENSLKTKRRVFMVVEHPPSAGTPMEEESVEEAVLVGETPAEAGPTGEAPRMAASMEEATPRREGRGSGHVQRMPRTSDPSQWRTWWRGKLGARPSSWDDC
ncbi:uncharacterized protein [Phaseolus vulgaris]|uniref:uncharacterized protein n=1 Tax=Phaseolus vulgaris TaxID=3885 RepID=UPI0035CAF601